MKHLLLTTIAAVFLVGCGPKAPDISIHKAAQAGNIEAVKQHLAAGADVNAKNDVGRTPLDVATNGDLTFVQNTKIADLLRKHGGKMSDWFNADESIHKAARAGHIEAVKQHSTAGTDVNAKEIVVPKDLAGFDFIDKDGHTPLHWAAEYDHRVLIETKRLPDRRDVAVGRAL